MPGSESRRLNPPPGAAPADDRPPVGALLRISWQTVRGRLLDGLRERGFDDLHPSHMAVLQHPGPAGLRPSQLAARARTSKQAMNHLLGQLERLGYMTRGPDPDDPRSRRVELTARGADAVRASREIVAEVETEWSRALGPARFERLRDLLQALPA